jgi:hypothetical protein
MASGISFIPIILNSRSSKGRHALWTSPDSPILPETSRLEKAVRADAWTACCFGHNRGADRFSVDKPKVRENLSPDLSGASEEAGKIAKKIRPAPDIHLTKHAQAGARNRIGKIGRPAAVTS